MPVEFLGIAGTNAASEVTPRPGGSLDLDYTKRLARAHEDNGWDRILFAYHSGSPDPAAVAAYIAGQTERINLVLAHRPNVSAPTYAAKTFATLDHISGGRFEVHFITGGSTADQAAEGDYLDKDSRYQRTREYIQIVKQAWTSDQPFDYDGQHYQLKNFRADIKPAAAAPAADLVRWQFGGRVCGRRRGIRHLRALGRATGRYPRADRLHRSGSGRGRPNRAAHSADRLPADHRADRGTRLGEGRDHSRADQCHQGVGTHQSAASQRRAGECRLAAAAGRACKGRTATTGRCGPHRPQLTGGGGNSTALVGTPETVAAALLDYYDLGINILSARGYDIYDDAIDFGRYVIPLVRAGSGQAGCGRRRRGSCGEARRGRATPAAQETLAFSTSN